MDKFYRKTVFVLSFYRKGFILMFLKVFIFQKMLLYYLNTMFNSFKVVYVYAPELFPTTFRAAGMGWVSILDSFAGFLAPYMAFSDNQGLSYIIYATVSLLSR